MHGAVYRGKAFGSIVVLEYIGLEQAVYQDAIDDIA